jgi:hypothetical protein
LAPSLPFLRQKYPEIESILQRSNLPKDIKKELVTALLQQGEKHQCRE